MRITLLMVCLGLILSQIVYTFWREEYRYSLPTPIPAQFTTVPSNSCVPLPAIDKSVPQGGYLLHFFNPDCPCSRFNLKHFKRLYESYEGKILFTVVIPEGAEILNAQRLLDLPINIIQDRADSLAQLYGVYSTPQAVIIHPEGRLYYRGNYNKARFCTQSSANYAQLSLDMLLANQAAPNWGPMASNAYGCRYDGHTSDEPSLFFWSQLVAE
ncbi:MAG: AhpC/TSA family protein [Bacteroidia bacterium]